MTSISGDVVAAYIDRTPGSRDFAMRAALVMPGGNTRTTTFSPPYPPTFVRGAGAWLQDIDGNRYVDMFYNGLSLIHGHASPFVYEAIEKALPNGTAWAGGNEFQIQLAGHLANCLGGDLLVRFSNSGSEACMLAATLAREVSGRELLIKFERAYHGSYPDLAAGLYGDGDLPGRTLVLPFNDFGALKACLAQYGDQVAAIIYEPVMFTGRVIMPDSGFLSYLEEIAKQHDVLTILDDCLMFRLDQGGSAAHFGLDPDLTVLGKFIGGGTPVGAVVGRTDLLGHLDPTQKDSMFHGGSFNGNYLGMAAGLATMINLTSSAISRMNSQAVTFRNELADAAEAAGFEATVTGIGSVAGIAFEEDPTRHEDDPSALNLSARFLLACLNEGVAPGPGGLFAFATCIEEEELTHAVEGVGRALMALSQERRSGQ